MSKESSEIGSRPQLVKLNQGLKLAEKWVRSMSKTTENGSTCVVLESRPARLGIGAAVPRVSRVIPSNDPVERKLRAKLDARIRRFANVEKESANDEGHHDSTDEESESRTKIFVKKRSASSNSSLQPEKKHFK